MSRTREGFTLIELLIVVVIIGILAAIAIPKFGETKERAYITSMKSDLKNMVSGAEASFSDNNTYANFVKPAGSSGVTLTFSGTVTGWTASASHALTTKVCTIGVGTGVAAGVNDGEPKCQ